MGLLRQLFQSGDVHGGSARIEALWNARHESKTLAADDAEDVAWLLQWSAVPQAANLRDRLWPKLLGLLTRWAYFQSSTAERGIDPAPLAEPFQRWLCDFLACTDVPWGVRAPALLLLAVASSASSAVAGGSAGNPTLAREALCRALHTLQALRRQRQPPNLQPRATAHLGLRSHSDSDLGPGSGLGLLVAPCAVTDLCAAACLLLEGMAAEGDVRGFAALLASLLAAIGYAIADLATAVAAAPAGGASAAATAAMGGAGATSAAAAAAQGSAAAALAALHASCRQLGAACTRATASAAAPAAVPTAGTAAAGAAAAPAVLVAAADVVRSAASRAATGMGGAYRPAAVPPGSGLWAAAAPGASAAAASGDGEVPPSPADSPRVALAVLTAAAGGFLEGCGAAVSLQSHHLRPPLIQGLQPARESLTAVLLLAAAASSSEPAAPPPTAQQSWGYPMMREPQSQSSTRPPAGPDPPMAPGTLMRLAVGYCWARLGQGPQGPLDLSEVAGRMAAAAAAGHPVAGAARIATAWERGAEGWHPSRGALEMLLYGSLGVGRLLEMAAAGAHPDAATEVLECQVRGQLFGDTSLLARGVLEGTRPAVVGAGASGALQLLRCVAAVAARLHAQYRDIVDGALGGQEWLAALPAAAAGALRDLLDRTFVVTVSVVAATYDTLAATHSTASATARSSGASPAAARDGQSSAGGRRTMTAFMPAAAVLALQVLADVQFIGLPLRAHGELVARLSAAVSSSGEVAAPLLALLPCYTPLAAAYGNGGAPVGVSRLAFLLPLAASCVPRAPDVGAAAAVVLPYIFLLLKGAPSDAICQAAHAVWAALLATLCQRAAEGGEAGGSAAPEIDGGGRATLAPCGSLQHAGVEVAASMVPYYVVRTCQPPCSESEVELLERGLRQCSKSLPLAHPVKAWYLQRLAQQVAEWARDFEAAAAVAMGQHPRFSAGPSGPSHPSSPATTAPLLQPGRSHARAAGGTPEAALLLVRRAAATLGLLTAEADFALIPDALVALSELMAAPPLGGTACRTAVLQQLHDTWLRSDDYARKPLLEEWLRWAVATPLPAVMGGSNGSGEKSRLSVRLG